MRSDSIRRGLLVLAAAASAITCSDAPTGPDRSPPPARPNARLALTSVFSAGAQQAAALLRQSGIAVRTVRVVIVRPGTADTLVDRTVQVDSGQTSVTLEVDLEVRSTGEQVTASLQFRDANGVVLYEGTQTLTVRPGENTPQEVPKTVVEFVGPGARATSLTVSPGDTTISTRTPLALSVTAIDNTGATIPNPLVAWSVSDPALASISATGTLTPLGPRGSVRARAIIPTGLSAEATIRLLPPPARIVVVGGGGQAAPVGSTLPQPFTVEVQAADGLPAAGEPVTFSVVTEGGGVSTTTATTDAQGRASTTLTLGNRSGTYEFRAVSGSVGAVTISTTATAAAPASFTLHGGNDQAGTVGTPLPSALAVRVTDQFNNPVNGTVVSWSRTAGTGTLAGPTSTTDAEGIARMAYTLGQRPGSDTIVATTNALPGAMVTFSVSAGPGSAARITAIGGSGQSSAPGGALANPLVALVTDQFGNPVPGQVVTWQVTTLNATLGALTTTTDASGQATNTLILGNAAQLPAAVSITASIAGASAQFAATITAGTPTKLLLAQAPPSTAQSGVPLATQPHVRLANAAGQVVALPGIAVTAHVLSAEPVPVEPAPGGTAAEPTLTLTGTTTAQTGADGVARFTNLAIVGPPGLVRLEFSAPSLEGVASNTITLTPGPAATLVFLPQAPTEAVTVVAGSPIAGEFYIESRDASGNVAPNAAFTATIRAGSAGGPVVQAVSLTTDENGQLGAADLPAPTTAGTYHVSAAIGTGPAIAITVVVLPGPAAGLKVVRQPSASVASNVVLPQQPTVRLVDAFGNDVAQSGVVVTAASTNTAIAIAGSTTATTDATGLATFSGLSLAGTAGQTTLSFTAPSLAAATSSAVTLTTTATATLTSTVPPFDPATDTVFTDEVVKVRLLSPTGAPIASAVITWSIPTVAGEAPPTTGLRTGFPWVLPEVPGLFVIDEDTQVPTLAMTTDANGEADVVFRRGSRAGPVTIRAAASAHGVQLDFDVQVAAGVPAYAFTLNDVAGARAGVIMPAGVYPVVQLYDLWGNPSKRAGVTLHADVWLSDPCVECTDLAMPRQVADPAQLQGARERIVARAAELRANRTRERAEARQAMEHRRVRARSAPPTGARNTPVGITRANGAPRGDGTAFEYSTELLGRTTAVTDADGIARFDSLAIGGPGGMDHYLEFSGETAEGALFGVAPSCAVTYPPCDGIRLLPGEPYELALESARAYPAEGDTITLTAQLRDRYYNDVALAGRTITWTLDETVPSTAPAGVFVTSASVTDAHGVASVRFVVKGPAGTQYYLSARDAAADTVAGWLYLQVYTVFPDELVPTAGDRQVVVSGSSIAPLSVRVLRGGAPVGAGTRILWTRLDGGYWSSGVPDTTYTDASGIATLSPASGESSYSGLLYRPYYRDEASGAEIDTYLRVAKAPGPGFTAWFGEIDHYDDDGTSPWNDPAMWSGNAVPTAASNVLVPQFGYYVTIPRLTSAVTVNDLEAYGTAGYAYIDMNGQSLTVTGSLDASYLFNGGTVTMTGTGKTLRMYASETDLVIAAGASVSLADYTYARGLTVNGTMTLDDDLSLAGPLTVEGAAARLRFGDDGYLYGATDVTFAGAEALPEDMAEGYLFFTGNFRQKQTYSPRSFRAGPAFYVGAEGPAPAAITFESPAESYFGALYLYGCCGATPKPVTLSNGIRTFGNLEADGYVALQVDTVYVGVDPGPVAYGLYAYGSTAAGRLIDVSGGVQAWTNTDFSGVTTVIQRDHSSMPDFQGEPPVTVELELAPAARSINGYYRYRNLVVRDTIRGNGADLITLGDFTTVGSRAVVALMGSDELTVGGNAVFGGPTTADDLVGGVMRFARNFTATGTFQPTGTVAVFNGTSPQTIAMAAAGTGANQQSFRKVVVAPGASLSHAASVVVRDTFSLGGSWSVGAGATLGSATMKALLYGGSTLANGGTVQMAMCRKEGSATVTGNSLPVACPDTTFSGGLVVPDMAPRRRAIATAPARGESPTRKAVTEARSRREAAERTRAEQVEARQRAIRERQARDRAAREVIDGAERRRRDR